MSRTIRCVVLFLVVTATACSSSVTEPTAPKCTAKSQNNSQSCLSQDYINPKV
jgi:hypothetical protein